MSRRHRTHSKNKFEQFASTCPNQHCRRTSLFRRLMPRASPSKKTCCEQFQILQRYVGDERVDGIAALETALQPTLAQLTASRLIGVRRTTNQRSNRGQMRYRELRANLRGDTRGSTFFATTADSRCSSRRISSAIRSYSMPRLLLRRWGGSTTPYNTQASSLQTLGWTAIDAGSLS